MGILAKLIWIFLNFICISIDITMFCIVVKMILNRRTVNWLVPFDIAGRKLVDSYSDFVATLWRNVNPVALTPQGRLVVGLVILIVARLLIMSIAGIL